MEFSPGWVAGDEEEASSRARLEKHPAHRSGFFFDPEGDRHSPIVAGEHPAGVAIDRSASRHLPPEIDDPVFAHLEGGDIDREPLAQVARPEEHTEVGRVVDETAQ